MPFANDLIESFSAMRASFILSLTVTGIGGWAFANNQLTSVSIPSHTSISQQRDRLGGWWRGSFDQNVTITRR